MVDDGESAQPREYIDVLFCDFGITCMWLSVSGQLSNCACLHTCRMLHLNI